MLPLRLVIRGLVMWMVMRTHSMMMVLRSFPSESGVKCPLNKNCSSGHQQMYLEPPGQMP
jgi:hypothetical protein